LYCYCSPKELAAAKEFHAKLDSARGLELEEDRVKWLQEQFDYYEQLGSKVSQFRESYRQCGQPVLRAVFPDKRNADVVYDLAGLGFEGEALNEAKEAVLSFAKQRLLDIGVSMMEPYAQ
jgi:hypothetical protein